MTRILFWNIQNFSLGTISARNRVTDATAAADRLEYILKVFDPHLNARPPDIIIIVEVFARQLGQGKPGGVLPSDKNSAKALIGLLDKMRTNMAPTWCLVPPLLAGKDGKCEAAGVFYNAASVTFTGPFIYANDYDDLAKGMPDTQENQTKIANYSKTWLTGLPNPGNAIEKLKLNRTWTGANGVAIKEWQGAGQWRFPSRYGDLNFPNEDCRPPFCTRFLDAQKRPINVYAIHTSPDGGETKATGILADIQGVKAVAPGEVAVIVGDFNVDSFKYGTLQHFDNPYRALVDGLKYKMLLSPMDARGRLNPSRRPYCVTHLLPNSVGKEPSKVFIATPYNNNTSGGYNGRVDAQHNFYPRFGYMGSGSRKATDDNAAIDNALVKYGAGLQEADHNVTIVNTIVGKPYDKQQPIPDGVGSELTGGYDQPTTLSLKPPIPLPEGIDPPAVPPTNGDYFNDWENFGVIRTTSDHLALVFDV